MGLVQRKVRPNSCFYLETEDFLVMHHKFFGTQDSLCLCTNTGQLVFLYQQPQEDIAERKVKEVFCLQIKRDIWNLIYFRVGYLFSVLLFFNSV